MDTQRDTQPDTYAAGVRLPYEALPDAVTMWIELVLGGPVRHARNCRGGFSPGVAAVVDAGADRRAFVKAVSTGINPDAVEFHRREAAVAASLPPLRSVPGFIADTTIALIDVTWAVSILPVVPGVPPRHPWSHDSAMSVLDAVADLAEELTPSPWPADEQRDRRLDSFFTGWAGVAGDAADPWRASPWVADHLPSLAAAEAALRDQLPGDTLAHRDLRADNVLVDGDHVWFVDWTHAGNAARSLDATLLLGDIVASRADVHDGGSVDVVELVRRHRAFAATDESTVWSVVAALAATMHRFAARPAPPGLPTIRAWQRQQAVDLLRFVTRVWPAR